jgi:hypothetical protein
MVKLLSAIFFCAGAFASLTAFMPWLRPNWARTGIPYGFLGCAGIGSAFMSIGVDRFFSASLPSHWHDRLVWLFFLGLAVGFVGMVLDKRRAKRNCDMSHGNAKRYF